MAKNTAEAKRNGERTEDVLQQLALKISSDSITIEALKSPELAHVKNINSVHEAYLLTQKSVREHPLNGQE